MPGWHSSQANVRSALLQVPAGLQMMEGKETRTLDIKVPTGAGASAILAGASEGGLCLESNLAGASAAVAAAASPAQAVPQCPRRSPCGAGIAGRAVAELAGGALAGCGVAGWLGALHHRPCPGLLPEDEVEAEGDVDLAAACVGGAGGVGLRLRGAGWVHLQVSAGRCQPQRRQAWCGRQTRPPSCSASFPSHQASKHRTAGTASKRLGGQGGDI